MFDALPKAQNNENQADNQMLALANPAIGVLAIPVNGVDQAELARDKIRRDNIAAAELLFRDFNNDNSTMVTYEQLRDYSLALLADKNKPKSRATFMSSLVSYLVANSQITMETKIRYQKNLYGSLIASQPPSAKRYGIKLRDMIKILNELAKTGRADEEHVFGRSKTKFPLKKLLGFLIQYFWIGCRPEETLNIKKTTMPAIQQTGEPKRSKFELTGHKSDADNKTNWSPVFQCICDNEIALLVNKDTRHIFCPVCGVGDDVLESIAACMPKSQIKILLNKFYDLGEIELKTKIDGYAIRIGSARCFARTEEFDVLEMTNLYRWADVSTASVYVDTNKMEDDVRLRAWPTYSGIVFN